MYCYVLRNNENTAVFNKKNNRSSPELGKSKYYGISLTTFFASAKISSITLNK